MKKIFKILRRSSLSIIIILLLLVVQAQCDLALPSYTSDIINIGIQQGGIKDNSIEVIREDEFNNILEFVDNADILINNYDLVKTGSVEARELKDKYPIVSSENIYVLKKDITKKTRKEINNTISQSLILTSILSKSTTTEALKKIDIDFSIPEGMSLSDVLPLLSKETKDKIKEEFSKQLGNEKSVLSQLGALSIKNEYKIIGVNTDKLQMDYIISTGLKMLCLAFLSMSATIITTFLASRTGSKFSRDLRSEVVGKVMGFSNTETEEFSSSSLITRTTNDIQQVQMLVIIVLRMVLYAPIIGIGALGKVIDSPMAYIIGIAVFTVLALVSVLFAIALPKFKILQKLTDKINLVSRETINGLPVIRAFSTEKHEEERFDNANIDLTKANLFVNRVMTVMMPTMMFIMNGVSILIVWVGAKEVNFGTMQVGSLLAFITYTMQIIMAFLIISMISIMLPRAYVSFKRIGEVLNKKNSIIEDDKPISFNKDIKGEVEFRDVYFRYPNANEDVLSNINFKVSCGQTIAFIGSTGSGKSTLVNLIPRFYDVTGGKILIDGVDIKHANIHDLRDKIGFVPQKGVLLSGTVKSNLSLGVSSLSKAEIDKALRIAQAYDFVYKKDKEENSIISQGGDNVSGGERQRLSIARAIAKNPEIYVFDDSFSALDYKTDSLLRKALKEELTDSTIFIVGQRISSIKDADTIIVLDKGEIVGIGKHKDLLKDNVIYREIALSQLSEEEMKK
ncbi:MAG: ABC transporter ATP-binding protein [Bacilli bacterium]